MDLHLDEKCTNGVWFTYGFYNGADPGRIGWRSQKIFKNLRGGLAGAVGTVWAEGWWKPTRSGANRTFAPVSALFAPANEQMNPLHVQMGCGLPL